ncbi:MAG: tetratricopeptide repeat protein [Acidobacteriota bacterium]
MLTPWLLILTIPATAVAAEVLPPIDLVRGLRSAKIAHSEGEHAREFESLRAVRSAFPDDFSTLYAMLVYHRDHDTTEEQLKSLRQALVAELVDPGKRPPLSLLSLVAADVAADADTLRSMADHLERRTRGEEAKDAGLLELLTSVYLRLDDDGGYIDAFERLNAVEPTDLRRWQLLRHYRRNARDEDAAAFIADWLKEAGPKGQLRTAYVRVLSRLGRYDDVVKQVDLLLAEREQARRELLGDAFNLGTGASEPYRAHSVILEAAWNLRDAGEDAAAERLFRRVVETDPENEAAVNALLYLYGSAEELDARQAEIDAELAAEEDPFALFTEGTERLTAGDAAGALPLLRRAAPSLPKLEAAWYNLGMAAYQTEDWETVVEAFGVASDLNATRVQTVYFRGLALEKLDRCEEAVGALEATLTLDPTKHLAHYYLASCFRELGELAKSKHHRELYDASR